MAEVDFDSETENVRNENQNLKNQVIYLREQLTRNEHEINQLYQEIELSRSMLGEIRNAALQWHNQTKTAYYAAQVALEITCPL
jgi:hypothetical protein